MRKMVVLGICISFFVKDSRGQEDFYVNAFALGDVSLLNGPFQQARDLNIKVLLQYDVDRLLAGYRKQAGLPPKASSYPNWAGLDGHIAGHYLSALAINYTATGNLACKQRMQYMLAELKDCQDANASRYPDWANGYLGAVPAGYQLWPKVKAGDIDVIWKFWVPWYNVHKMYAGLRDAWLYAGEEQARQLFLKFCEWAVNLTRGLSNQQMQLMLASEHGGMNEIFVDAFQMTGNTEYLNVAKRFSHHELLDPLSGGIDKLDNLHANTQVPKVIGFARIGEMAGDPKYKTASVFFWETVTGNRSLAHGGNSRREFFPAAAANTDFINDVEGPESCNTYNMLKLSQDLFRMQPDARYMDFYERALYNHILSTQHPVHGGFVYFTPARPRHYRVYSSVNKAMWCCVGSGMENHGKYAEQIYSHRNDSLFLNLFIASQLRWNALGISLEQRTSFPNEDRTTLVITGGRARFTLMVRYPGWVKKDALKILVNGKPVVYKQKPSSYIGIERNWSKGDKIEIHLPMRTTIEHLPHVEAYIAFMHGPVLLGAKTGIQDLKGLIADDGRWSHIPGGDKLPIDQAPVLIDDSVESIAGHLVPIKGKPLQFRFADQKIMNDSNLVLEPFFRIHDARYMMYWMALTPDQYGSYKDSIAAAEKERIDLEHRTVDFVIPGEQQPEADHLILSGKSRIGNLQNQAFREASDGGFFSYLVSTGNRSQLGLMVRYWGAEWNKRVFDIYIDDQKLVSVDNTNRWNQSRFFEELYEIPGPMLQGKQQIRIKIQAKAGAASSPVYYMRLITP